MQPRDRPWEWDALGWTSPSPVRDQHTPIFEQAREAVMGRHTDSDGDGIADTAEIEVDDEHVFRHDDGTVYRRVDPEAFREVPVSWQ